MIQDTAVNQVSKPHISQLPPISKATPQESSGQAMLTFQKLLPTDKADLEQLPTNLEPISMEAVLVSLVVTSGLLATRDYTAPQLARRDCHLLNMEEPLTKLLPISLEPIKVEQVECIKAELVEHSKADPRKVETRKVEIHNKGKVQHSLQDFPATTSTKSHDKFDLYRI